MKQRFYIIFGSLSICLFPFALIGAAQTTVIGNTSTEHTVIDSVRFECSAPLEANELGSIILSQSGEILNDGLIRRDTDALTEYYQKTGWWNARVTARADTACGMPIVLVFEIDPGGRAIFGDIEFHAKGGIPPFIFIPESDVRGQPLEHTALEHILQIVVSEYTVNGYPDVVLKPSLSAEDYTVHVRIEIDAGQRATVDSIAVYGLSQTKDYVVRREIDHLLGENAGSDILRKVEIAISKLGFLSLADTPFFDYSSENLCLLVVNITEGAQGSFDGAVGYQPAADDESSGEIVGKIDLAFPNLMGTGRSSYIRWENLGKEKEDLALSYTEPHILGSGYNITGSFTQEQREIRDYTKTIMQVAVGRDFGRLTASGGYRYEKVSSDSLNSSGAYGIDVGIVWNGIDNPFNPRTGIRYALNWSAVSKEYRFGNREPDGLERLEFNLDHYIPTLPRQTVAFLLRYRRIDTSANILALADHYWLGGTTSIRGYREKIFPAVKAFWATAEYRLLRGNASRFFVFADSGIISNDDSSPDGSVENRTISRTGYGFGLRIESQAGTLGFDYGLGQGEGFSDGKFHVGLTNSF